MTRQSIALVVLALVAAAALGLYAFRGYVTAILPYPAGADVRDVRLPRGFRIEVFAGDVPGARSLALGPGSLVVVGTRGPGKVYAVRDPDGDGRAEPAVTLAEGLDVPNGVAVRDGALYVAEIEPDPSVRRARPTRRGQPGPPAVVAADYPTDRAHGWKFIGFGPDGKLYVPVGAPCNVCEREDQRYAAITRLAPDGTGREIFARGVRNTVGFDWQPETGVLWFTDNGRDHLGDDTPPDELNRAPRPGLHFGFPYCHGRGIRDPELNQGRACDGFVPPAGSWARTWRRWACASTPAGCSPPATGAGSSSPSTAPGTGARRSATASPSCPWTGTARIGYEVFAEGWLQGRAPGAARSTCW